MVRRSARSTSSAEPAPVGKITASAALIGVGTLVISGAGLADAATGGNLVLGAKNSATKVTKLSNSKGTPLSLRAKSGSPPLKVNSKELVKRLNANFLNGLSSDQLQRRVTGTCTTAIKSIGGGGATSCAQPDQVVFTSSGNFTVPAGISHVTGEMWGGGGGSGYILGGGGSGAFEKVVVSVSPGDIVHVVVGTAGTGVNNSNGTNGGNSTLSINSGAVIAGAGGGQGGAYPCEPVSGGSVTAPTGPALGLDSRAGTGGDCGVAGGTPGFAGAGGPGYQAAGTTGLVVISLDH